LEDTAKGGNYLFTMSRPFVVFETIKKDRIAVQCKESSQKLRPNAEYMAVVSEM
jgi:hypothetical protein